MLSPPDSGSYDAGLRPDAGDAGPSIVFDAGLVVGPPDGGKDAGSDGSVDADVASPADAGGDPASVVGTVVLPPVAT